MKVTAALTLVEAADVFWLATAFLSRSKQRFESLDLPGLHVVAVVIVGEGTPPDFFGIPPQRLNRAGS